MKVLIVSKNHLFRSGIEALLQSSPDLTVRSSDFERSSLRIISEYQPSHILVQTKDEHSQQEVHEMYELMQALHLAEQCRVLKIALDSNQITVFDKQTVLISDMGDLLDLIMESPNRRMRMPPG